MLRQTLGYAESRDGYQRFLDDCSEILGIVKEEPQLDATFRKDLRLCDIEAMVFAKVQRFT